MSQEACPLPFLWRGVLIWARAAAGGLCLARLLAATDPLAYGKAAILAAYVVFAVTVALKFPWLGSGNKPGISLLPLLLDLAVFLAYVVLDPVEPWLAMLFFLYVLLGAALRYSWREVALVAVCSAVVTLLRPTAVRKELALPVLACGAAAAVLAVHVTRVQSRMSLSLRQSVLYRAEAERARESERQRIAADFHDGPLQSFVGFQMRLEILRRLLSRDTAQALVELASLQDLCRSQVAELRAFIRSMRPVEVDGAGLSASVRRLLESYQKDTGIEAKLEGSNVAGPSDPGVVLEVLQIIREALNNVQKHSRATQVTVSMGMAGKCLEIAVADNGSGFAFSGAYSLEELELLRMGPASIMRRVRNLSGDFSLSSTPGQGSLLRIRVPA